MAVFMIRETFTIKDIWDTDQDFINDLTATAPPFFSNEYLIDVDKSAVIKWAYNTLATYYEDNQVIASEKVFKSNFLMKFINYIPAYFNLFNGDLSKIQNINNFGDFTFTGEQMTEANSESPFSTPISTNRHVFNQKSDKELIEALEYRESKIDSWVDMYRDLFQRII